MLIYTIIGFTADIHDHWLHCLYTRSLASLLIYTIIGFTAYIYDHWLHCLYILLFLAVNNHESLNVIFSFSFFHICHLFIFFFSNRFLSSFSRAFIHLVQEIRQFAVRCISTFTDNELEDFMLQLVQTLKHEPHHSSSLCYFLFLRAIRNPQLIGHTLFWYLESELESVEMADRFRLLKKELLLAFNEEFRNELLKQVADTIPFYIYSRYSSSTTTIPTITYYTYIYIQI